MNSRLVCYRWMVVRMPGSIDSCMTGESKALVDNMWDLLYRITNTWCWLVPLFDPRGCPKNSNQLHPTEQNTQKIHIDVHRQTTKRNQKRHQVLKRRTTDTTRVFPFKNPLKFVSFLSYLPQIQGANFQCHCEAAGLTGKFWSTSMWCGFFPSKNTGSFCAVKKPTRAQ